MSRLVRCIDTAVASVSYFIEAKDDLHTQVYESFILDDRKHEKIRDFRGPQSEERAESYINALTQKDAVRAITSGSNTSTFFKRAVAL